MSTPLFGLLLVGGESRRMGRDKALLSYDDGRSTQLERSAALLQACTDRVFVSQRKEQDFPLPEAVSPIYDQINDMRGPLCGILSAQQQFPHAHWLVLACDLPFLTVDTLQHLIDAFRAEAPQLTAYQSSHDGLPEPLCAIYPSGSDAPLKALADDIGKYCPRKLLILKQARLIKQHDPRSLDNINTDEEYQSLTQH
ncbi:molybdenum cofactor guanylyltransferase [Coraliomargarita akajimensis]|uniref:Probable molybdenum cofactor guanylyltransferase n=1 Tax=Coraliomargarita akajimensis (strain DSM 45221 / IAM 15411 / JCM 23193 / KCTC 12865 / 04OKA010-24) TaxID=583355 RepID=D5EMF2_CORAD|nr:NTP transferase domain-containing protein [Coraliomargarita akajimensis]ADE53358.1 bifunctional molybdenum cofactor biosynthesis protein (molybdopterin-guanine dinucleotide biosynthesis protein A and MoaD) [Coraliomargarita akajimensis DSM 45221]